MPLCACRSLPPHKAAITSEDGIKAMSETGTQQETDSSNLPHEELTEEELKGLSGGFKFHKHERNPTQVPLSEPRDD